MARRVLIPFRHAKRVKVYADAVRAAGMEPVTAPVDRPISLAGMSGLVLMGGSDVNPRHYHAPADPQTEAPDDERDLAELDAIDQAIHRDLPILAICRGLQILNVYHGGTLVQHLPTADHHDRDTDDKGEAVHDVVIAEGSRLHDIAGVSHWKVNSRHHQAAAQVGDGLEVSARDVEDHTIEGLERGDKRFVVAVQWHPEDQVFKYREQLKLFQALAAAL